VGFELDYLKDSSTLVSSASSASNLYGGLNLTMLFVHSWNFIGGEENFNLIRGNFMVSIGGTYASGYIAGLVRLAYEWRLAKHWGFSAIGGYSPPATAFIGGKDSGSITGAELGLGVSYLFN
jgi:hypothetical protein